MCPNFFGFLLIQSFQKGGVVWSGVRSVKGMFFYVLVNNWRGKCCSGVRFRDRKPEVLGLGFGVSSASLLRRWRCR